MPRPFIEFLQSQDLAWQPSATRPGVREKRLSDDDETGAATLLIAYPPHWRAAPVEHGEVDEEFFVLRGALDCNARRYGPHAYAYWPAGYTRTGFRVGEEGAVLLVCRAGAASFRDGAGAATPPESAGLVEHLDTFRLPWDRTNMDPNIAHLNAFRKNLRLAPDGSCRTYLLAGLPQGSPASGTEPLERHPHVEEMFMVAGDMPCSLGVMRAGAYFWRPPMIWHGADCTLNGFLMFMRTPGTNRTVSEWSAEPHVVTLTPSHRPQLPDALRAAGAGRPAIDPVEY
jgi:hypothetical protein